MRANYGDGLTFGETKKIANCSFQMSGDHVSAWLKLCPEINAPVLQGVGQCRLFVSESNHQQ